MILGLGSNIGNTRKNIIEARNKIPMKDKILSPIIKTKALLTKNAPSAWDIDYLNAIVIGKPLFTPLETLQRVKKIEKQMKRIKIGKYSPRTIDIDILFWGDKLITERYLTAPHREVLKRFFTLKPIASVCPLLIHPTAGITLKQAFSNYCRRNKIAS